MPIIKEEIRQLLREAQSGCINVLMLTSNIKLKDVIDSRGCVPKLNDYVIAYRMKELDIIASSARFGSEYPEISLTLAKMKEIYAGIKLQITYFCRLNDAFEEFNAVCSMIADVQAKIETAIQQGACLHENYFTQMPESPDLKKRILPDLSNNTSAQVIPDTAAASCVTPQYAMFK